MMMILLWILSAQPLIFAVIFAILGHRKATRLKAGHRIGFHTTLPAHSGKTISSMAMD